MAIATDNARLTDFHTNSPKTIDLLSHNRKKINFSLIFLLFFWNRCLGKVNGSIYILYIALFPVVFPCTVRAAHSPLMCPHTLFVLH